MGTAFVSRGFDERGTQIWEALRRVIEPCLRRHGIDLVDLQEEPRAGEVVQNILDSICAANLVIVVLTLRDGAVPAWICEEASVAMGRDKRMLVFCQDEVPDEKVPICIRHLNRQGFSVRGRGGEGAADLVLSDASRVRHILCDAVGRQASNPVTGTFKAHSWFESTFSQDLQIGTICAGDPTPVPWETVLKGITRLGKQVKERRPMFTPNLIVGINHVGLMAATLIQVRTKNLFCPVGSVMTTPAGGMDLRRDYVYCLPTQRSDIGGQLRDIDPREIRSILVVDGQIKSGRSAVAVMNHLKMRYPEATVHLAILCACKVPGRPKPRPSDPRPAEEPTLGQRSSSTWPFAVVPDFLAYVTEGTILLPIGLR